MLQRLVNSFDKLTHKQAYLMMSLLATTPFGMLIIAFLCKYYGVLQ
jgi:hypothetical protein